MYVFVLSNVVHSCFACSRMFFWIMQMQRRLKTLAARVADPLMIELSGVPAAALAYLKSHHALITALVSDVGMLSSDTDASDDGKRADPKTHQKRYRTVDPTYRTPKAKTLMIALTDAEWSGRNSGSKANSCKRFRDDYTSTMDPSKLKPKLPGHRTREEADYLMDALADNAAELLDIAQLEENVNSSPDAVTGGDKWLLYRVPGPKVLASTKSSFTAMDSGSSSKRARTDLCQALPRMPIIQVHG